MANNPHKIVLEGVERKFGQTIALSSIDLSVRSGEFLTLLGPSGCGKTTLLRIIAGFVDPTAGRVWLDGKNILGLPPSKREVGMVFQNYALFPHLTVADNIAFGLKQRHVPPPQRKARVEELLGLIKLASFGDRYPGELSGGQRQRVAIARAIAHPPQLLLMDEPLGALDLKLREEMQAELRALQKRLGITTIYVTHDQTEAMAMSDRIAVMNQGKIEQLGSARDIYFHPANRFVASFVGKINMLRLNGTVIGLRPEWLGIARAGVAPGENHIQGTVEDIVFLGDRASVTVVLQAEARVIVDVRLADGLPSMGERVSLSWRPDQAIVLD